MLIRGFAGLRGRRHAAPRRTSAPAANSEARQIADRSRDDGRWHEAANWYRKHLDQYPDDVAIWVQLGNSLKEAASFEAALVAYQNAVLLDTSGDADVFLQLGHLQKLMGRRKDAIDSYHASVVRAPDDNPARGELAALVAEAEGTLRLPAQPNDLRGSLETIEGQLERLIIAAAKPQEKSLDVPDRSPPPVSPSPQRHSIPPLPAETAAASARTIFFLVQTEGKSDRDVPVASRRLGQTLLDQGEAVSFVRWNADAEDFEALTRNESNRPVPEPVFRGKDDWLFVADVAEPRGRPDLLEVAVILAARRLGLRSAFIFPGAEPLRLAATARVTATAYEQYMQALLLADLIIPTSSVAAAELNAFFVQHQQAATAPLIKTVLAPEEARRDAAQDWSDYTRRIRDLLTTAADQTSGLTALYYWVDPAASPQGDNGVFARRLADGLTRRGITLIPVVWDATDKRLVAADGRVPGEAGGQPGWVLHPGGDAVLDAEALAFAGSHGLRVAAVMDDATDPAGLTGVDKVFAAGERRFEQLQHFLMGWRGRLHSAEHRFKLILSPNEVPDLRRPVVPRRAEPGTLRILVVVPAYCQSDLAIVLGAAAEAASRSARRLIFTLAGSSDRVSASEREALRAQVERIPEARWEEEVGNERLKELFGNADFVIDPGFAGRRSPVVAESLWRGLPILVDVGGSARATFETGIVAVDLRDEKAVADAILKLTQDDWRHCLAREALARPIRSWDGYAEDIAIELATDRLTDRLHPLDTGARGDVYATLTKLVRRPRLSLCLSTYNRAGWLALNLQNIFAQIAVPRDDLEILVVDNASTDDTAEVVRPYLARPDFRYVRNRKNVGMLGNLTVTAQKARAEYIWILGDDDFTRPGTIERVLGIIDRHPGIGLIYLNYGYSSEDNPANVTDLTAFLDGYNVLQPSCPDEVAPVKRLAAKTENFYTAIYAQVYRRDHALRAYGQDTSGRIFSTMLTCVPTAYYVLNYMAEEPGYWVGEPALVVNSNVSYTDYVALLDLEHLPRAWDLAERMGADPGEVDRRRSNRLWLVKLMWQQIFENDATGNSAYLSPSRVLTRLKHLPELDEHIGEFMAIYRRARDAGHPAATIPTEILFAAFGNPPN
jgi:tetratricopeptide (TPR) repeat protein